ncbi:unnamed protein product [Closterium sp. NIES-54]
MPPGTTFLSSTTARMSRCRPRIGTAIRPCQWRPCTRLSMPLPPRRCFSLRLRGSRAACNKYEEHSSSRGGGVSTMWRQGSTVVSLGADMQITHSLPATSSSSSSSPTNADPSPPPPSASTFLLLPGLARPHCSMP